MEEAGTVSPVQRLMQVSIRGCLLGLAVGDALGGPVETMTREAI